MTPARRWIAALCLLGPVLVLTGCRGERPSTSQGDASAPGMVPVSADQARAYALGHRREIELADAALQLLSCANSDEQRTILAQGAALEHVERGGAVAAGLSAEEYRQLVAHVDTALRRSPIQRADLKPLDSLRVELAVRRARIAAEASESHSTRSKPCVARS